MDDPMEEILRQVASGELTPEDAEPIIAALSGRSVRDDEAPTGSGTAPESGSAAEGAARGRAVRVRVQERGRTVVSLRIPMSWTGLTSLVPGLSSAQVQRVSEALRNGERGPILDIQDADGDGVIISTE
jgi:hypothetical protein